jgi:molecular chaperone Hsp33
METETVLAGDAVRRFIFEGQPVRGHWAHLDRAWQDLRTHRQYPPPVDELLGQAVAASMLLAATLKFRGTLTFQLQGDGVVNLLVAQCTDDQRVRAVARYDAQTLAAVTPHAPPGEIFRQLTGSAGRITVTVEAEEKSARYQGVVPLSGESLAQSLEAYFASSEQLPTRVVLAADAQRAAGMLVQKLPQGEGPGDTADVWQSAQWGLQRLSPQMLLGKGLEANLAAVFPGHDVRVFGAAAVQFECRCNPTRVAAVLRALGSAEIREVLREQGTVTVSCEFCERAYSFDSIDIEALFADSTPGPEAIH